MGKRDQEYIYSQIHHIRPRLHIDIEMMARVIFMSKMAKDQVARYMWHNFGTRTVSVISPYTDERLGRMVACGRPIEDDTVTPLGLVIDTGELNTEWSGRALLVRLAAAAVLAVITDQVWAELHPSKPAEAQPGERIKCRFCNQAFAKFGKGKGGKVISGFETLMLHISEAHPRMETAICNFVSGSNDQALEDLVEELDGLGAEEIRSRLEQTA